MPSEVSTDISYNLGMFAQCNVGQRFLTKDELKAEVDDKTFKKYEPLFDYFDKIDNQKMVADGQIDLATFTSFNGLEIMREKGDNTLTNMGYVTLFDAFNESGINEKNVAELCNKTGNNREDVISFVKDLFRIQASGSDTYEKDEIKIQREARDRKDISTKAISKNGTTVTVTYNQQTGEPSKILKNGEEIYTESKKYFNLEKVLKQQKKDVETVNILNSIFK